LTIGAGCISASDQGVGNKTNSNSIEDRGGNSFGIDWHGAGGETVVMSLESECPSNDTNANWEFKMTSPSNDGQYWIFGPTAVLDSPNQVRGLRAIIGEFNEGDFHENGLIFETGEALRTGLILVIGAEVEWSFRGVLNMIDSNCIWKSFETRSTGGSLERISLTPENMEDASVQYNIPSKGWTHVSMPIPGSSDVGYRIISASMPNGFSWTDQSIRRNGGFSGPAATYFGSFQSTPGTLNFNLFDSGLSLEYEILVFHFPFESTVPLVHEIGYCDAPSSCRSIMEL
jgi:hypothetical protein